MVEAEAAVRRPVRGRPLLVVASVVGLALVGVFIRAFGAAESGGRASPVLEIVAFVLGVWVPLFALIYACVRSRVAVVALAFCVGLSVNMVFLTHAIPAAAVTDNSSVFTFENSTTFSPPNPNMRQNYTPTSPSATTCPGAGGYNWQCAWTSDTFTSGQTFSAGSSQVDLYVSNNTGSGITRQAQGGIGHGSSDCGSGVSRPSVANGDVMIFACAFRGGNSVTIDSVPSGWTLIGSRIDNGATISVVVYSHVVTDASSEPTTNAWNLSSTQKLNAYYMVFSGVDNVTPTDGDGGQATASGTSHAAPSVTTTVANDQLLTFHATATCTQWTPPAGMTEITDGTFCSQGAGTNADMEINELALAGAGATGAQTATNDAAAVGVTKTVALRANQQPMTCNLTVHLTRPILFESNQTAVVNSGTQITISKPTSAAVGDTLLAGLHFGGVASTSVSTVPSNWTLARSASNGGVWFSNTYTHVVQGGEPANYTWTFNQAIQILGDISAYSGVDTVTPVDLSAAATGFQTMPSLTTTGDDELLVAYFGGSTTGGPSTWPNATGMVERSELGTSGTLSMSHQEGLWPVAGATGTRPLTASPGVNGPVGQWLALRPASGAQLGTASTSITSPAGPTLKQLSMATPAITFATGDHLQLVVAAPDDSANCGASVSYDSTSSPSKLTVAMAVPDGAAGLLLLAPALPVAGRWWKRSRP